MDWFPERLCLPEGISRQGVLLAGLMKGVRERGATHLRQGVCGMDWEFALAKRHPQSCRRRHHTHAPCAWRSVAHRADIRRQTCQVVSVEDAGSQ